MTARFPVEVERFAVARGEAAEVILDDLGMLAATGSGLMGPGLLKVVDLDEGRSFCLLGEPGIGKTTALRAVTQGISDMDDALTGQEAVLWVSLAEVADSGLFQERITVPVLDFVAAGGAPGDLTLVLDGLDECPIPGDGKVLAGLLRGFLRRAGVSGLRVLVGCRSAEYPQAVHNVLADALESFASYELAPLRLRDVRELAASRGADADEFLREVRRTGTGPLASLPLSLDLLLRSYSAGRGLQGSASDLYEVALVGLASEPDPERELALDPVPGEQVLAVASRLCCYLLLCGRAAFWKGQSGQVPDGTLDPFSLAGGQERQAGGTFPVTPTVIDAALRSGLFTARGSHRVVPAHAAFAAFLAARYLVSRGLPDVQLRTLLTVSTSEGTGLIPALRETAAWLVALRPQTATWLPGADLARIATYSAIIPDPQVRSLMTERMLADPGAFLAGGWRRPRGVAHPGLAAQLIPGLTALADVSAAQPGMEKSFVVLTLASEADPVIVAPLLLEVAARNDLNASLRALAGRTAAGLDEAGAVPVLKAILTDVAAYPERDPDDEIRGTVLDALWPRHLTVEELTASLTRRKRNDLVGGYYMLLKGLPGRLSDGDVPHLLRWLAVGGTAGGPATSPGSSGEDILAALVDRALACQETAPVIGSVADVAAGRLLDYGSLRVPAALDERDASGAETRRSRELRRVLAAELAARYSGQYIGWLLAWGWDRSRAAEDRYADAVRLGQASYPPARRGLVDAGDIAWVIDMALACRPQETQSYVPLLRGIFDTTSHDAQEAADRVRGTLLWPAFAFWFEPVILGSGEADVHKRVHESSRPHQTAWEGAAAHLAQVLDRYEHAPGDATAFAELLYLLQFDPATGHGTHSLDGDLASRPGIQLLPQDEWQAQLADAARNYLAQATPPGTEPLDQPGTLFWPAEVGYLALAYLKRREQAGDALSVTDASTITAWAVAILAFPDWADNGIKRVLLARLAEAAPDLLPGLIARLITAHVTTGALPTRLEALAAAWTRAVGDVLVQGLKDAVKALTEAVGSPPAPGSTAAAQHDQQTSALHRTISLLTQTLAHYAHPPGVQAALDVIDRAAAADPGAPLALSARAAALGLLHGDAERCWDDLARALAASPPLRDAVLADLADESASPILPDLTDSQLAGLWTQLAERWRYQDDPTIWPSGAVSRDQQTRRFRDGVLTTLKRRGTSSAVQLLRQLAQSNPDLPWLAGQVREADETLRGQQWEPLRPDYLTLMLENSSARIVRSSTDLADLVARAIADAAEELTRTGYLLWDNTGTTRSPTWRPKTEPDVGGWLTERLTERLGRSGVVINREVLVRQTASVGLGLTVDVQADAPPSAPDVDPARCRIELKGNWNRDLMSAMRSQLAEDYLIPDGLQHGVYVTAWFDTQLWTNTSDSRRRQAASQDREESEQELARQADDLRLLGLQIRSVLIDIPRPVPSARREPEDPAR